MGNLKLSELINGSNNKAPVYSDKEIEKLLESSHVHLNDNIGKPPSIMRIRDFDRDIDVLTAGNISMTIGAAKSKKSFATTFMTAAAASGNDIQFKFCPQLNGKAVVVIDTEQSNYHVHRGIRTVINLMNYDNQPDLYRVFALRKYNTELRFKIVEWVIYNLKNVGLLIIDGVRDLISDINSQHEAKMITDKQLQWTGDTGIHIHNILHENKEGGKARGHLGTELMNKCETVFGVRKCEGNNKHISIIRGADTRGSDFNDIAFQITQNDKGLIPTICEVPFDDKL